EVGEAGESADGLAALRAACVAAWAAADGGRPASAIADDRPPACAGLTLPA
ncbi:MAG: haloacid dehalogenase, partial [Frankia sp.]|nr:haloacid dehalogenase [Frankia sp.]